MSDIKVESGGISATIAEFTSQMSEMEQLLANIKETTNNVKNYWAGDDSDNVLTIINNFMTSFDVIVERNKNYTDFLEKVIADYKAADDAISENVAR